MILGRDRGGEVRSREAGGGTKAAKVWLPEKVYLNLTFGFAGKVTVDIKSDNKYTMFGAFRASSPLSGGLLWYAI
jgi:hypothetical protein